uniref:Uncharacterized protein n=1 Tax=Palpitomonas bilix TaxID=652834 RepID=A0A7S3LV36_9EUKA|mmetsp:Transcript_4818/g.10124  ORF Transcript_4818/g.10124 Transcript_4818/m.10124 type:complete len:146 (+) Transcript_4818:148-585(+)
MSSYGYGPGTTAGGFRSDAVDAFNGKKQYEKVTTSIVPDRGYDLHDAKFVKSQKAKLQHYEKQNLAHADVLTMTAEGEKLARSFKEKEFGATGCRSPYSRRSPSPRRSTSPRLRTADRAFQRSQSPPRSPVRRIASPLQAKPAFR